MLPQPVKFLYVANARYLIKWLCSVKLPLKKEYKIVNIGIMWYFCNCSAFDHRCNIILHLVCHVFAQYGQYFSHKMGFLSEIWIRNQCIFQSDISKLNRSALEKGEFQTSQGKSHFILHLYFSAVHAFN